MTPDKRLNQIEPVLADVVQKVDRLIEGNGQIIHEVSKLSSIEKEASKITGIEKEVARIASIERAGLITAKGLADLTVNVNKGFDYQKIQINNLSQEVKQGFAEVNQQFGKVNQQFGKVDQQFGKVDQQFDKVDQQFSKMKQRFVEVNQRFDQLITLIQDRLK